MKLIIVVLPGLVLCYCLRAIRPAKIRSLSITYDLKLVLYVTFGLFLMPGVSRLFVFRLSSDLSPCKA